MRRRAGSRPPIPARDDYGAGTAAPVEWETAEKLLSESRYYWLSTTRADHRPHAVPMWAVWWTGGLFFATSPETVTARNIAANANAVAHPDDPRRVVIVEGLVTRLAPEAVADEVVAAYEAKYGWNLDPADPGMPYYELRPTAVVAWDVADIRGSASRWRVRR